VANLGLAVSRRIRDSQKKCSHVRLLMTKSPDQNTGHENQWRVKTKYRALYLYLCCIYRRLIAPSQ